MSGLGVQSESEPTADHRLLGLSDEELDLVIAALGRHPTPTELAIYSVMWSEHCSYKSSRAYLGRLPSKGQRVLVGPGENAGVVDVGDGVAIALRIESHNHPSFIEPYQGAATGVGGILRDIFAVGARPIALMDALFFGPLDDPRSHYIADGVVRGIAGYGNAVGVPTVGGQTTFDTTFAHNPLVNVFCLGVLPASRLVLARADSAGNLAVLLGSRTGRDGIGGVSVLASSGFSASEGAGSTKRPSVQIADPFEEKRLIEACLELLEAGLVLGIQDLGGAGLCCATSEIAARAGLGIDVDVDAVPRREVGMNGAEVMTSESQERMLAIVDPSHLPQLEDVCRRWEIEAAVVGVVTAPDAAGVGRLRVVEGAERRVIADVPARSLADEAPRYKRPAAAPSASVVSEPEEALPTGDASEELLALVTDPAAVYTQYDHRLFLNTVIGPGEGDATLLKLAAPGIGWQGKALALSVDANPSWCALDPRAGAAATVAESALNVACGGAAPLALVDCLNFGNPEHPEVMWQLRETIEGIAEACAALALPVVGGNVSFYNESAGVDIDPTPVVAVVGLLEELERKPPSYKWSEGEALVVLGPAGGSLAGSRWARQRARVGGTVTRTDLEAHRRLVEFVSRLVADEAGGSAPGLVGALHDVSDGGLGLAIAECVLASGIGAGIEDPEGRAGLFFETPGRVLIATPRVGELLVEAADAGVPAKAIGAVGGRRLKVAGLVDIATDDLFAAQARWRRRLEEPSAR
jgi:phosphoribosylformylglycinamidine synthase subunit PurL